MLHEMAKIDQSAINCSMNDEFIFISFKNGKNHIYSIARFGNITIDFIKCLLWRPWRMCMNKYTMSPNSIQMYDTSRLLRGSHSLLTSSSKELYRYFSRVSNLLRANNKIK